MWWKIKPYGALGKRCSTKQACHPYAGADQHGSYLANSLYHSNFSSLTAPIILIRSQRLSICFQYATVPKPHHTARPQLPTRTWANLAEPDEESGLSEQAIYILRSWSVFEKIILTVRWACGPGNLVFSSFHHFILFSMKHATEKANFGHCGQQNERSRASGK